MDMKGLVGREIGQTTAGFASRGSVRSAWRDPIVGYALASDPLFERLRHVAHPGHLLPSDLLEKARTVIAFFLPFERPIPASNKTGTLPSAQWATAYSETNELIALINARLVHVLGSRGYRAVTIPATHDFDAETLVSAWSHRHAGYVAGLGTFGLNRLLITEKGCCGRLGSLVTDLAVEPTPRKEDEACLQRAGLACTACLEKCRGNALSESGFDARACYRILLENETRLGMAGRADVCGKCACGLPCSLTDPVRKCRSRS